MSRNIVLTAFLSLSVAGALAASPASGAHHDPAPPVSRADDTRQSAQASTVHTVGGCAVFPADNWWNTPIDDLPVHRYSTKIVNRQAAGHDIHLDLGVTEEYYGIPITIAPADTPLLPLTFGVDGANYGDESDPGPFPVPANARIEGWRTTKINPTSGDRHVIVVHQGTCQLIEFFNAKRVYDGNEVVGWRASASATWDLASNDLRPKYWTSADAAGLPILPGLLTYEEAASGEITHALRFTLPIARNAFITPARHCGQSTGRTLPSYGMRFRLKGSFSAAPYTGPAKTIVKAMKKYGLMYADQGSSMYVTGSTDDRWEPVLDQFRAHPIDGSKFEVVQTGKPTICS